MVEYDSKNACPLLRFAQGVPRIGSAQLESTQVTPKRRAARLSNPERVRNRVFFTRGHYTRAAPERLQPLQPSTIVACWAPDFCTHHWSSRAIDSFLTRLLARRLRVALRLCSPAGPSFFLDTARPSYYGALFYPQCPAGRCIAYQARKPEASRSQASGSSFAPR